MFRSSNSFWKFFTKAHVLLDNEVGSFLQAPGKHGSTRAPNKSGLATLPLPVSISLWRVAARKLSTAASEDTVSMYCALRAPCPWKSARSYTHTHYLMLSAIKLKTNCYLNLSYLHWTWDPKVTKTRSGWKAVFERNTYKLTKQSWQSCDKYPSPSWVGDDHTPCCWRCCSLICSLLHETFLHPDLPTWSSNSLAPSPFKRSGCCASSSLLDCSCTARSLNGSFCSLVIWPHLTAGVFVSCFHSSGVKEHFEWPSLEKIFQADKRLVFFRTAPPMRTAFASFDSIGCLEELAFSCQGRITLDIEKQTCNLNQINMIQCKWYVILWYDIQYRLNYKNKLQNLNIKDQCQYNL